MKSRELSIPIYLNQKIVFDLLAIVEQGFSKLRAVKTSESESQSHRSDVGGQIGSSNVFAFLGIGLGSSRSKDDISASQREITEERVFTPTSLFSRLRNILVKNELLLDLNQRSDISTLELGTFVEFSAKLQKNPLIGSLEGLIQVLEMAYAFTTSNGKNQNTKRRNVPGNSESSTEDPKKTLELLRKLMDGMTQPNTVDLIALLGDGVIQAVVPVELEYFSDRSPAAIIDGEFIVLGKVVRSIPSSNGDSIDLLRGTGLGQLQDEYVEQLWQHFDNFKSFGFNGLEIVTHIKGPAIQIVPIAIYI